MCRSVGLSLLKNGASSLALAVALGGVAWAGGLPGHGHYTSGQGTIRHHGGGALVIDQSSQTGIINWNSFSIGKSNRVSFDNGHGATLNLVNGGDVSRIAGQLRSTGSVYLVNPQGVVITGSGRVNTQGSFAATSRVADGDLFADGKRHLRLTGKPAGDVIDDGQIRSGGTVRLSGRNTTVSGSISGPRVNVIASGETKISGTISAQRANGDGGTVIATGRFTNLARGAEISASGRKGGIVLVGGDKHGGAVAGDRFVSGRVRNAGTTLVQKGARITASGTAGSGGHVVVWSQKATEFDGRIVARGTRKGNGGSAEVSSHGNLAFQGLTNLNAAQGTAGELLLDPWNLTIKATGQTTNVNAANGTFEPVGPNSVLLVSAIKKALKNGSVAIVAGSGAGTGAGDVLVDASLAVNTSHYLTLSAYHSIVFHDGVKFSNAGSSYLALYADNTGQNPTGTVKFKGSSSVDWSHGGQVFLRYNPVDFAHPTNYAARISVVAPNDLTAYMLIHSIAQLQSVETNLSGTYEICEDIDASATKTWNSGAGFIPLSNFTGQLTGDGFTITNLTSKDSTDGNVGLFSKIEAGAKVQSIIFRNPHVSSVNQGGQPNVGVLAGLNNGSIYGIQVIGGKVSATGPGLNLVYIGGIVGDNAAQITFSDSDRVVVTAPGPGDAIGGVAGYNGGTLDAVASINSTIKGAGTSDMIGGIAGLNNSAGIIADASQADDTVDGLGTSQDVGGFVGKNSGTIGGNTTAAGSVSGIGGDEIGGFVGVNDVTGTINDQASSTATVAGTDPTGSFDIGGFAGLNLGTLTRVSFNGKVSANSPAENEVGGLVGNNGGAIDKSSAYGTVSILAGDGNGGGLVGRNRAGSAITRSYAIAHVITAGDNSFIGGLVGQDLGGTISRSYAGGPVTANGATDDAGGLVGYSQGTIDQSYAYGWVIGNGAGDHVGGLLGYSNAATITNSYWDLFTSGLDDTAKGVGNIANASGVTGEATDVLKNGFLPTGFSGTDWGTANFAYPWLKWAGSPDVINTGINLGGPVPATGSVIVRVDGKAKGMAWIGADSAIYLALPHGSLSNGKTHTVFVYFASGPLKTNIFYTGVTGGYNDGGLFQDYLQLPGVGHLSTDINALKKAIRGISPSRLLFSIGPGNQLTTKHGENVEILSKASAGALVLDDPLKVGGTLLISSAKPVTQTKPIDAALLALSVTGNVTLRNKDNDIALLAGDVTGNVDFNTNSSLVIGSAGFSTGLNVQGDVMVTASGGDLTLDRHVRAKGSGDALVLAANGRFINNAGKNGVAVTSGGGRFLIFANKKIGTKVGGLSAAQLTGPQYAFNFAHRTYMEPKHKGNLILFP